MSKRISHVIGFDDAPFAPDFRGDVALVGAVFAGPRLEGVLRGRVRRDGVNSTRVIASFCWCAPACDTTRSRNVSNAVRIIFLSLSPAPVRS